MLYYLESQQLVPIIGFQDRTGTDSGKTAFEF
jgi:hypothetical protein